MRSVTRHPHAARAAIALLGGLLIGGWAGGGLVWVLNRNKYKNPNEVAPVALTKADEMEMVPADAMGFAHVRVADLWRTEAMSEFRKVIEKAGPDAVKALEEGFVPAPSTLDRATVVVIRAPSSHGRPNLVVPAVPAGPGPGAPKGLQPKGGAGAAPPPPPLPKIIKGDVPAVKPVESPSVVAILAFSAPFDQTKVREANFPNSTDEIAGSKRFWHDGKTEIGVHFASDRVMVIGPSTAVQAYLKKEPAKEGPLASSIKLATSGNRHLVAAVNMAQVAPEIPMDFLPEEIRPILRAESMALGMVVGNGAKVDLRASYRDDAAAQSAEKTLRTAAETGRKKLGEVKTRMEDMVKGRDGGKPRPIEELPEAVGGLFALGAVNMLDEWLADPPLVREGNEISATVTMSSMGSAYMSMSAMSIGMLLPAVSKVREAAARTSDSNNLHQLALAMHNYHDAMGRMPPPAWGSKLVNGKQTGNLSWRVAILPYIEQQNLYQQFKLDEPWDSENNKKLIPLMPRTYANPLAATEPGNTYYKVFVGGGAAFDRQRDTRIPASFPDGTSNTILIAEGGDPVIWTKPDDFEFDPKKPLPNIWLPGKPGINVAMADGSVRFVNRSVSEQTLKNAIQADDGNVLGPDWNGIGVAPFGPFDNAPFPIAPMPKIGIPKGPKIGPPPGNIK